MTAESATPVDAAPAARDDHPVAASPGWWAVVAICAAVTLLAIGLGTVLVSSGHNAEALFGLAGTALGAIAGLLAPSPPTKGR